MRWAGGSPGRRSTSWRTELYIPSMPSLRSGFRTLLRGVAALVVVGQTAGLAPMAAGASTHCTDHHRRHGTHAPVGVPGAAAIAQAGAGMPADCPHCAAADCAFLAPCAGGATAVRSAPITPVVSETPFTSVGADSA